MFKIIFFLTLVCSSLLLSLDVRSEEKVIYEYKKYEKIDLGDLEVKGELITPGDISVRERERKNFSLDLYQRRDFHKEIQNDFETLR